MKIFSIILATLFFLSFTNIASAEATYTVTNISSGNALIFFDDTPDDTPIEMLVESSDYFSLKPNECVKLTENQFYNINVIHVTTTYGRSLTAVCEGSECKRPDNYEIINYDSLFSNDDYKLKTANRTNMSETCKEAK